MGPYLFDRNVSYRNDVWRSCHDAINLSSSKHQWPQQPPSRFPAHPSARYTRTTKLPPSPPPRRPDILVGDRRTHHYVLDPVTRPWQSILQTELYNGRHLPYSIPCCSLQVCGVSSLVIVGAIQARLFLFVIRYRQGMYQGEQSPNVIVYIAPRPFHFTAGFTRPARQASDTRRRAGDTSRARDSRWSCAAAASRAAGPSRRR